MYNRLRLNFDIHGTKERREFVEQYLTTIDFADSLTEHELETLADYILWGDRSNSKLLGTRWSANENVHESLDGLIATCGEALDNRITPITGTRYVHPKNLYNRDVARAHASSSQLEALENLWHQIDRLQYGLTYYDYIHKRTKHFNVEIANRLTPKEQLEVHADVANWTPQIWLGKRREIIPLRAQQFSILPPEDTHLNYQSAKSMTQTDAHLEYGVAPLGLLYTKGPESILFCRDGIGNPMMPTNGDILLEARKNKAYLQNYISNQRKYTYVIDLENPRHVEQIILGIAGGLWEGADEADFINFCELPNWALLKNTYDFFLKLAWKKFTPIQRTVYEAYVNPENCKSHQKATDEVNQKRGTTHSPNYISTIFHKGVIKIYIDTVSRYKNVWQEWFDNKEFVKCSICGGWMPVDMDFFRRKSSNASGFYGKCKDCQDANRTDLKNQRIKYTPPSKAAIATPDHFINPTPWIAANTNFKSQMEGLTDEDFDW